MANIADHILLDQEDPGPALFPPKGIQRVVDPQGNPTELMVVVMIAAHTPMGMTMAAVIWLTMGTSK